MDFWDTASKYSIAANLYNTFGRGHRTILGDLLGYTEMRNAQQSYQNTIDYNEYLRKGNERALADWNKNVGSQGRTIKYPEFSYSGQIARADTSIANAGLGYDSASASFNRSAAYRTAGLFGLAGKLSRYL